MSSEVVLVAPFLISEHFLCFVLFIVASSSFFINIIILSCETNYPFLLLGFEDAI